MSIQTELARIKGAKADLKSWVEENGVAVPDGTLIDGLVELAKTVETGGGTEVSCGSFILTKDVTIYGTDGYSILHGLSDVPDFFALWLNGTYVAMGAISFYIYSTNMNKALYGGFGSSGNAIGFATVKIAKDDITIVSEISGLKALRYNERYKWVALRGIQ